MERRLQLGGWPRDQIVISDQPFTMQMGRRTNSYCIAQRIIQRHVVVANNADSFAEDLI